MVPRDDHADTDRQRGDETDADAGRLERDGGQAHLLAGVRSVLHSEPCTLCAHFFKLLTDMDSQGGQEGSPVSATEIFKLK